jgi:hypothetical protein
MHNLVGDEGWIEDKLPCLLTALLPIEYETSREKLITESSLTSSVPKKTTTFWKDTSLGAFKIISARVPKWRKYFAKLEDAVAIYTWKKTVIKSI